jgi:hypothetical protein
MADMYIRCKLFALNLETIDALFRRGDTAVIVLADTQKVISKMDGSGNYYSNSGKIKTRLQQLQAGYFEIPVVVPVNAEEVHWVEGIHQVNAAFEHGLGIIPISTAARYAETLKAWVGAAQPELAHDQFDFSACAGTDII